MVVLPKTTTDIGDYKLDLQLNVLSANFKDKHGSLSFNDVKDYLTSLTSMERIYYSEVITLLKSILVLPATNATSERTFSAMRRIKSYMQSTMIQERLNHLMILHVHRSLTESLDLIEIINSFVKLTVSIGSQYLVNFVVQISFRIFC